MPVVNKPSTMKVALIWIFIVLVGGANAIKCYYCEPGDGKDCKHPEDFMTKDCPSMTQCNKIEHYSEYPYYETRDCDMGDTYDGCRDLRGDYPDRYCYCQEDFCNGVGALQSSVSVLIIATILFVGLSLCNPSM
eukprot:TCALIF_02940-PB protein Name:"Protein of unknown function" AED:0.00 eAED:0.00 QI:1339/1/1/1/0.8/0.66/6/48/133